MFIVSRSYMSSAFRHNFDSLYESGIYSIWERYRKVAYSNWEKGLYKCYLINPNSIGSITSPCINKSSNEEDDLLVPNDDKVQQAGHSLLLSDLITIFFIHLAGLVISGLTLISEKVYVSLKSTRDSVSYFIFTQ